MPQEKARLNAADNFNNHVDDVINDGMELYTEVQ